MSDAASIFVVITNFFLNRTLPKCIMSHLKKKLLFLWEKDLTSTDRLYLPEASHPFSAKAIICTHPHPQIKILIEIPEGDLCRIVT